MDRNEEYEYDYSRVQRSFQQPSRTRDRSWTKGLVMGLILGVMLCTGTAYAVYAGEMAYESAMQYDAPAAPQSFPQTMIDQEQRNSDAPRGGSGGYRARRGQFRGPFLKQE